MPHYVRGEFKVKNLISNIPNIAKYTDSTLLNAWGLVVEDDSLWVAVNHSGTLSNYELDGSFSAIYVTLTLADQSLASPTGLVKNHTRGFRVNNIPASLLTVTEDGVVFAYVPSVDPNNGILVIDNSGNDAIYKGATIANGYLYATDFHNGQVDVFDENFVQQSGFLFIDPSIPSGYAPFNIVKIGNRLFVSYAKQDANAKDDVHGPGFGYVSIFEFDGTFVRRFTSNGPLNSPWGMLAGPERWHIDDTVMIGNFGDGVINVFSHCGKFLGELRDENDNVISIDGLWDFKYDDHKLFFVAGPSDEADGLVGYIKKH